MVSWATQKDATILIVDNNIESSWHCGKNLFWFEASWNPVKSFHSSPAFPPGCQQSNFPWYSGNETNLFIRGIFDKYGGGTFFAKPTCSV